METKPRSTISIFIPCHNEEKTIARCVQSCLEQTRKADQIIVVDDGSTDSSAKILEGFGNQITLVRLTKNTGNKSYVQQYGLSFVTGDVFVSTDADTILDSHFLERVEADFADERVVSMAGYVKIAKYNWLTAIRELDYLIGQEIHKTAQSNLNFLVVVPGCAGAFRTDYFRKNINFDHDTVTEDLDFTYKINKQKCPIIFDKKAIVYTQDPADLKSYIIQMRRWYGGGWQNLLKHLSIVNRPASAMELSLLYFEGLVFSFLMYLIPIINIIFFFYFILFYSVIVMPFGVWGALTRKRIDLLLYSPLFPLINYLNAFIFLEQFAKVVIMRQRNFTWISPARRELAN